MEPGYDCDEFVESTRRFQTVFLIAMAQLSAAAVLTKFFDDWPGRITESRSWSPCRCYCLSDMKL